MKKFLKYAGILVLIAAVSLLLDYAFGVRTYGDLTMAAVGATVVSETVTTETTETQSAELNMTNIDAEVVKIDPSRYPFDTCLRQGVKTKKVASQQTEFYSRDYKPFNDTVKTAIDASGLSDDEVFDLAVDNISMWSLHDSLMIVGIPAYDPSDNSVIANANLVCYINKITKSTSTLQVQPVNGYIDAVTKKPTLKSTDDIAVGDKIIRLARAEAELSMQTAPYAIFPVKTSNNCQNYMAQIEQSTFDALTKKEVTWGFNDFEEANIKDMKGQKELSFLFGAKAEIYDSETTERVFMAGGATQFLTKTLEWEDTDFSATNADAWFVALTKKVFQGNSGSQIRYAFLGADLIEKINAVPTVQKQIEAKNTEVKWGLTFNEIVTNFGTLRIIKHDLLSEIGLGDMGFVFDLAKVEYHKFVELTEKEIDLKGSGQRNSNAKVIQEVSCPVFKYPDVHMVIKKKAA